MAGALAALLLTGGCASESDMATLRQPPLPPLAVLKADKGREFYRNIFVQEVSGAPEFRWFDGGAILTTRPTRVQTLRMLRKKLYNADMLDPSALDADYLLHVTFNDLRGPDMVPGSDKLSSASITFQLTDRHRPGQVVYEKTVEASYRVRWSGITPEAARAFIAGPIGVTKDNAVAPVGGVIGGAILGYYLNDAVVLQVAETPLGALLGAKEASLTGGEEAAPYGFWSSLATGLALSTARGHYSDVEAALAGGLISGVGAASPFAGRRLETGGEVSAFNGTERRLAATQGLLYVAFENFMSDLVPSGSVTMKRAVSCDYLNPNGHRAAYVTETRTEFALDCPGSKYNERWGAALGPSRPPP